jgi:hypothetical protein
MTNGIMSRDASQMPYKETNGEILEWIYLNFDCVDDTCSNREYLHDFEESDTATFWRKEVNLDMSNNQINRTSGARQIFDDSCKAERDYFGNKGCTSLCHFTWFWKRRY